MRTTKTSALLLLAAACLAGGATAGSNPTFDRFKALTGDWIAAEDSEHVKKGDLVASYRLTGGGSAVVEDIFPGTPHQMTTVYHMDGEALIATHYCPQGNQPRLDYHPELSGQRLEFRFRDATNLENPAAAHQHAFWIEIAPDAAAFCRNETYLENGEPGSETTTFNRIPQPTSNP